MVAGGWPPSLSKSVIALLPGADNWTPLASLPGGPLQGAAPGIVEGRIQLTVASEVLYDDQFSCGPFQPIFCCIQIPI